MGAQARPRIEVVLREQLAGVRRDEVHGLEQVLEHRLADEVVEVDAHPARLDALAAARRSRARTPCERSRSMPSRRWPYGPAHEQPPRAWMPNRSLSSATTKLWCR